MYESLIYYLFIYEELKKYKNNMDESKSTNENIYLYNIIISKDLFCGLPIQIEILENSIKLKLISNIEIICLKLFPNYTNEQFLDYACHVIEVICKNWNQLIEANYIKKIAQPSKLKNQYSRDFIFAERELKNTNEINYAELFSSAFEITDEGKKFLDSLGQK